MATLSITGDATGSGTATGALGGGTKLISGDATGTGSSGGFTPAFFTETGESYCNIVMGTSTVALDVESVAATIPSGAGRVEAAMKTIAFDMRSPFLMQGQPYHPAGPCVVTETTTGSGTVVAPDAPETYTTVDVTDLPTGTTTTVVQPNQRWVVSDAGISGGQNGGAQFNYITTWTPTSGNTAWNWTSPGFPYRPYYGDFEYASGRPYGITWNKTLSFAGRYDEFMQLNQTITQPATFMIVTWQVKLNGTATYYPIFNRYPVDVSAYGFSSTVDPNLGYRIFERGGSEMVVGSSAIDISGLKDFDREAIYTFTFNGSNSLARFRNKDVMRQRARSIQGQGTGSSSPGMIISGSTDVNYFMVVPEVLYFAGVALDQANIDRWETELYNKYKFATLKRR